MDLRRLLPSSRARAARIAALLALLAGAALAGGQTPPPPAAGQAAAPAAAAPGSPALELPQGYGELKLGMGRDEVVAILEKSELFLWRGPEDVSLLPSPNQSLIEVSGVSFIRRAFFQFDEGKLWVIILNLAPERLDHYSVWSSLVAKYGQPSSLSPSASVWENGKTRVSLERPLTLRYLDLATLGRLKDSGTAKASVEELERRDFLGGL